MRVSLREALHISTDTSVYSAILIETGEEVAVKLSRDNEPSPRTLEKLRHEHTLLNQAQGPGIVRALGLFPYGAGLALVMERWRGSLDRLLSQGPLPVGTALRLGAMIARALGHIHRRRVVHRDIKPQTVTSIENRRVSVPSMVISVGTW